MTSYSEMLAMRSQRRVELAARRLPKFFEDVDRMLKLEETTQRRYERFGMVDRFVRRRRHELRRLDMCHKLDIDEWDDRRLEGGFLPALNICAVVDHKWIVQYFLVREPFFPRSTLHLYVHVQRRGDQARANTEARQIPYMASNYACGDHHPKLVIQSLIRLCDEATLSDQTNGPATYA